MTAIKTVHLVFFSGTGGTARIAARLEQAFSAHQIQVHTTNLGQGDDTECECDLLLILYPVMP